MDQISVINATTILPDAEVKAMMDAVELQIQQHFYPIWGISANLTFVPKGSFPLKGTWQVVVANNSDQAGVLGYHDITVDGQPLGKVFAETTLQYKGFVSVTLSHEILEMLGDPDVNLLVQDLKDYNKFWAYEDCDAVEADELGYDINGIRVSDFVTPDYFETFRKSGKFDYLNHLTGPVPALSKGGYMAYVKNGRWKQIFADAHLSLAKRNDDQFRKRPHDGSRRSRRIMDRQDWIPSTVPTV
jgi:hypothetical protein